MRKNKRKKIGVFVLAFIFILFLFFKRELLESLLFLEIIGPKNISSLSSQQELDNYYQRYKPFRNWRVEIFDPPVKAAISAEIDTDTKKILYQKNPTQKLALASLTKLMTAVIVLENYDLDSPITILYSDLLKEEPFFKEGKIFSTRSLLESALIESNNVATEALAQKIGKERFVALMNEKAKELKMTETFFYNPTGLDLENGAYNYSSAKDLVVLAQYISQNHPLIWEISTISEKDIFFFNGGFHHRMKNTNELLEKIDFIVGGKTGWTPKAKGCLLLVIKNFHNNNQIINVVLGAEDRLKVMEEMVNWIYKAYHW